MSKKIIYTLLLSILFIFILNSLMAQKSKLQIGDSIPNFTLKDQHGNDFSIENIIHKNVLVIYFYPKDDTPGCVKEACSFRDEFEDFKELNATIIGISSDNVNSHKKFAEKYNLPFTLLADTKKEVQKLFGVPKSFLGIIPGRVTYIVGKDGKIKYIFNSLSKAKQHIVEAKKIIENLN